MKRWCRISARAALVALLTAGCSTAEAPTLGELEGEWDVTPGGTYTSGTFVAKDGAGTLTVVRPSEGSVVAEDEFGAQCTLPTSRYEIAASAGDGAATITVSSLREYDGAHCPDSIQILFRTTTPVLRAERLEERSSVLGSLSGKWRIEGGRFKCDLVVEGSSVKGQCEDGGSFDATIANGVVSGSTSGGLEFGAQRK